MRGREVFMASLEAHGVEAIFGNPGTTENPVLDSLAEHPAINYYVALHEGVAVGAAGFYAQASGKVGVANLHVAPGLGNAIGMLYGALKAGSPLVVTAGQQDTRMRLRDPILGHDLVAMAAPVTKWAVEARSADELGPILRRAFKLAQEPPTGPVFVALPIDVMEQETAVAATTAGILHARSNPDAAAIDKLAQLLAASRNPGIVAGDDVAVDGAGGALVALAERLGASVYVESLRARQPLPFNHANFRGRMPYAGGDIARLLAPHDVVVLIGGRFFEEVWFDDEPWLAPETLVVQIEAAPQRLAHNLPLDLGVLGAPAPVLAALGPALDDAWSDEVAARAAARQRELLARREREQQDLDRQLADATADRMNALRACVTVARTLPPRAILVDESITAYGDVMRAFALGHGDDYFAGRGGGIGQGLAGALGVAVANHDRPIVALSGDGSAMYSIQALWSAAHHGLDIVFVILSNREYRVLKHNLDTYRARFGIVTDKPYPHMNLAGPALGFVEMAQGMGVTARSATSTDELAAALVEAHAAGGPWLIEAVIEGKGD